MTKPTILQTLLNKPSQTYSFPVQREYYSTRKEMARIACEENPKNPRKQTPPSHPVDVVLHDDQQKPPGSEDDDTADSIYYTPSPSPRASMALPDLPPPAPHLPQPPVPSTRTRAAHVLSIASSLSSTSLDAHSLFEDMSSDSSTLLTSHSAHTARRPRAALPRKDYAYTDEDWAKDVRWLVPPTSKSTTTPRPPPEPAYFTAAHGMPNPPRPSKLAPPSLMMNMSALLEEEEYAGPDLPLPPPRIPRLSSGGGSPVSARRHVAPGPSRLRVASSGPTSTNTTTAKTTPLPPSTRSSQTQSRPTTPTPKPPMRRRRSRSLDHPRPASLLSQSQSSTYAPALLAHPVPSHAPPSHGTQGYSGLVLPRAPAAGLKRSNTLGRSTGAAAGAGGRVDLTLDNLAQTTMASVEVVRGLSSPGGWLGGRRGLFRRRTVSSAVPVLGKNGKDRAEGSILGFTSHRAPPAYVPGGGVLVQVWAVGVDGVDGRLVGVREGAGSVHVPPGTTNMMDGNRGESNADTLPDPPTAQETKKKNPLSGLGRTLSLRARLGRSASAGAGHQRHASVSGHPHSNPNLNSPHHSNPHHPSLNPPSNPPQPPQAPPGFIPGRSFVGRVLEAGFDVRGEVARRGEWVVGLLDVRKSGALTEFIVVDRHRIQRVPHPRLPSPSSPLPTPSPARRPKPQHTPSSSSTTSTPAPALTLEELALLPLCGLPAYRAVRTFMFAFSSVRDAAPSPATPRSPVTTLPDPHSPHPTPGVQLPPGRLPAEHEPNGSRRRALVLRGHDGAGAMAVQMLVLRGWRVCVHAPCAQQTEENSSSGYMAAIEDRVRTWGAEEVIFDDGDGARGAAVRVMDGLRADGDAFDAVLDTIGGKEVREAAERLLRSPGTGAGSSTPTLAGALGTPASAAPPTLGRSGSILGRKLGSGGSGATKSHAHVGQLTTLVGDAPERAIPSAGDHFRAGLRALRGDSTKDKDRESAEEGGSKVGYAWVSVAQDVDWEGEDVRETLGAVLRMALQSGVRPWVGPGGVEEGWEQERVVPFERAPEVFVDDGPLGDGATAVVKVAA